MQNHVIMAFRKRLSNRGYSNISIRRVRDPYSSSKLYVVSACESLSREIISVELTVESMYHMFR